MIAKIDQSIRSYLRLFRPAHMTLTGLYTTGTIALLTLWGLANFATDSYQRQTTDGQLSDTLITNIPPSLNNSKIQGSVTTSIDDTATTITVDDQTVTVPKGESLDRTIVTPVDGGKSQTTISVTPEGSSVRTEATSLSSSTQVYVQTNSSVKGGNTTKEVRNSD